MSTTCENCEHMEGTLTVYGFCPELAKAQQGKTCQCVAGFIPQAYAMGWTCPLGYILRPLTEDRVSANLKSRKEAKLRTAVERSFPYGFGRTSNGTERPFDRSELVANHSLGWSMAGSVFLGERKSGRLRNA